MRSQYPIVRLTRRPGRRMPLVAVPTSISCEVDMHTHTTLGLSWWRNASVFGRLACWLGIALLLVVPLPNVGGAQGLVVASAARLDRDNRPDVGSMLQGRGHPPA